MITLNAKHQKSEAKMKVKQAKKFSLETKLGSEIMRKILNFASFAAKAK
jgi:hypothetical protein